MSTKKDFLLVIPFLMISNLITAQISETVVKELKTQSEDSILGWKKGFVTGINFSQTSLTNWAAGGQNSLSLATMLSGFVSFKNEKVAWDNTLDIGYGFLNQNGVKYNKKTDDRVDLSTKYGYRASKNIYYALLLNFKTQMAKGYDYPNDSTRNMISNFFAPAYLVGALGVDIKPSSYLSLFVAPFTGKFTFVTDSILSSTGAFGVKPGKEYRSEFGGYVRISFSKADFKPEVLKNLSFTTKVDFFSNYADKPQNIVVNWEALVAIKVNKYLNMNLSTMLIYDDKIKINIDKNGDGTFDSKSPRVQFKEILGVGLSVKL